MAQEAVTGARKRNNNSEITGLNDNIDESNRCKLDDSRRAKNGNQGLLSWLHSLDLTYTEALGVCTTQDAPLGNLRPLMKILELSCHGIPWIFGSLLFLLSVHRADHIEVSFNLLLSLLFDVIIIALIKLVIRRNRPASNKQDMFATVSVDQFSFPSGHTSRAVLLTLLFSLHVLDSPTTSAVTVLWAVCVSFSRVMLGRHHVTDVVCGIIVGVMEYIIVSSYWIPQKQCLEFLEPFFGHFHFG
ncbi:hypothetical protein ScPMuIL_010816 [Solemya velum]